MRLAQIRQFFFYLLLLVLAEETIRYAWHDGDFIGYVIAGEYALHGQDLYSHWLNTWPPLFSIFAIPIYALNEISPLLARLLWQTGSLFALIHLFRRLISLYYGSRLVVSRTAGFGEMAITDIRLHLPFFLAFKYILDNFTNLQINIYMLALCLEAVRQWKSKGRSLLAGALIGLTMALKVYTLFFVVWFLFNRQWKVFLSAIATVLLLNIPVFLFFGVETASAYYQHWWVGIAQAFPMILHKNQSLFAAIWRLTVEEDAGLGIATNFISITMDQAKKFTYVLVLLLGAWPAIRLLLVSKVKHKSIWGMALFFALIPLLSPLAWKAYFIFLLPAQFVLTKRWLEKRLYPFEKIIFVIAHILLILSSDIFIGMYASDVAELYSAITLGAILLVGLLLIPFFHGKARMFEK